MGARTTLELVKLSAEYLATKGVDSPRLDAELLLAHVLGCDRMALYLDYEKPLEKSEVDEYRELIRRRGTREPAAYLIGKREFFSLPFAVGTGALIPRPETEVLVERALERMGDGGTLLDLGTGTGAVGLTLLNEKPGWTGVGVELSPEAAYITRMNCAALGLEERFEVREGDLYEPVGGETFDLIVSNPPYVRAAEIDELMAEVRDFEPRLALDGGEDGLDVIRRIVGEAPERLNNWGSLLFEFGFDQGDEVFELLEATPGLDCPAILMDYEHRPRVGIALKR